MKIKYLDWNPRKDSLDLVRAANNILDEYRTMHGLTLTLRQLYYQFVAGDVIPNTERSYKNLGALVTNARNAGLISWTAIEDRNRGCNFHWSAEDAQNEVDRLPSYIRFDQWARQDNYIEVWVEKEALGNIMQKACDPYLVPYMSCKGYLSASEAWRAGQRIKKMENLGKRCTVIHLGDHDPSGLDMTRDNNERLELYGETFDCEVRRIALNRDQIDQYAPPPNPAKLSDSRAKDYIKYHGNNSWELDALKANVLVDLVQNTVKEYIDFDTWERVKDEQKEVKDELTRLSENYTDVRQQLLHEGEVIQFRTNSGVPYEGEVKYISDTHVVIVEEGIEHSFERSEITIEE